MNRALGIAGIVAGALLVGYALFGRRSDQELIAERLQLLGRAVSVREDENLVFRKTRLDRELGALLSPEVRVQIPELGYSVSGVSAVTSLATAAGRQYPNLDVSIEPESVTVDGEAAESRAEVTVLSLGDDLSRERRPIQVRWTKDSDWKIDSIQVQAPEE